MPKLVSLITIVSICLLINACSFNGQYRTQLIPCTITPDTSCGSAAIQYENNGQSEYHLGFIEFDDQGQLRQRQQMEAVLDYFYNLASREDVILTVFVHGWHHDAEVTDTNVLEFQRLLRQLSIAEIRGSEQDKRAKRKILGVYLGWRGDSIEIPFVNNLTFWDRKSTAQEVGLQGVTEALVRLEQIVNIKVIQEDVPKSENSRMVVVGHSFGGAVVYSAIQQLLVDRYYFSRDNAVFSAEGFGDLTLLINPAFEALRYSTLYDIGQQQCRRYFSDQLPRLVVLTSEADLATRYAFPAGRIFSTFTEKHDKLDRIQCTKSGEKPLQVKESQADLYTVGHFEPYWTHKLAPAETKTRGLDFNYRALGTRWSQQDFGDEVRFEQSTLTHLGRTHPLNPFLNVRVDGKLIGGHNDIWGEEIISFVRDLIVISTTPVASSGK